MGRGVNPVDLGGRAASANQPSVKALYVESLVAATEVDKCLQPRTVQGRAKERELSLVREVPPGLVGCASAALSLWVAKKREIHTGSISFA